MAAWELASEYRVLYRVLRQGRESGDECGASREVQPCSKGTMGQAHPQGPGMHALAGTPSWWVSVQPHTVQWAGQLPGGQPSGLGNRACRWLTSAARLRLSLQVLEQEAGQIIVKRTPLPLGPPRGKQGRMGHPLAQPHRQGPAYGPGGCTLYKEPGKAEVSSPSSLSHVFLIGAHFSNSHQGVRGHPSRASKWQSLDSQPRQLTFHHHPSVSRPCVRHPGCLAERTQPQTSR